MDHDPYFFPADVDALIICALTFERDAVLAIFAQNNIQELSYRSPRGTDSEQRCFKIGNLTVLVITCGIGGYNSTHTATMAEYYLINLKLTILCGTCGGIPQHKDRNVFIGDVIIGTDVVLLDLGRRHNGGQFLRKEIVAKPWSQGLKELLYDIQNGHGIKKLNQIWSSRYRKGLPLSFNAQYDPLYKSDYVHSHRLTKCFICASSPTAQCSNVQTLSCSAAGCESQYLVGRIMPKVPSIFFGPIGCSNSVIKDSEYRDAHHDEHGLYALDMEGYGVRTGLPDSIVVKGVSNYADSHKDKKFQAVAAQNSAAVALSLLEVFQDLRPGFFARTEPLYQIPAVAPHSKIRRDDLLQELAGIIDSCKVPERESLHVLISGFSGSGKTQLARDFALQFYPKECNRALYYIDCTSIASFKRTMAPLVAHFGVPIHPKSGIGHLFELRRLLEEPSNGHRWLMILDNVKDASFLEPSQELYGASVLDFVPDVPWGTLLWISRASSVARALQAPELVIHTSP